MSTSETPMTDECLRTAPKHPLAASTDIILITPAPQLLELCYKLEKRLAVANATIDQLKREIVEVKRGR